MHGFTSPMARNMFKFQHKKQLFVMENILADEFTYNSFLIFPPRQGHSVGNKRHSNWLIWSRECPFFST